MGLSIMNVGAPRCSIIHQPRSTRTSTWRYRKPSKTSPSPISTTSKAKTWARSNTTSLSVNSPNKKRTKRRLGKRSRVTLGPRSGSCTGSVSSSPARSTTMPVEMSSPSRGSVKTMGRRSMAIMCFPRSGNRLIRVDPLRRPSSERLEVAVSFTVLPEPAPLAALVS